jgi:integrase
MGGTGEKTGRVRGGSSSTTKANGRPNVSAMERRASALRLIHVGESLAYVKEQLGHHSMKITVDVYRHLLPGTTRRRWTGWMM